MTEPRHPTAAGHDHGAHDGKHGALAATPVIDPVCGMEVDPTTARASLVHGEQTYYCCSPSCRQRFHADPGRYLPRQDERQGAATGTAGQTDPVCGMTVDPARAAGSAVREGRTYFFCSTQCSASSSPIRAGTRRMP